MDEQNLSFEESYESYKRRYPLHRGPQKIRRTLGWFDASELCISILFLVLVSTVLLALDMKYGVSLSDVLVEAQGLLMDTLLFGCIILWFNIRRDKRERIGRYHETLEDYRSWNSEEGVLRKVGVINRLIDIGGPSLLPPLDYNQLPNANFQGVSMSGTYLSFSNLTNAFLNGTHLAWIFHKPSRYPL
jgi:hypothetical protein